MPRYLFNVFDGYSDFDDTGTELSDIHDAKTQAVRLSGEAPKVMLLARPRLPARR